MKHAFLLPELGLDAKEISEKDLSSVLKHLKALRISKGEQVFYLNGKGAICLAECQIQKPLSFKVTEVKKPKPITPEITLILAPPKNDALSEAVAQATEMGVKSFAFYFSDYCVQKKSDFEKISSRAHRVAVAACEQCVQAHLPEFWPKPLLHFNELLKKFDAVIVCDEELALQNVRALTPPINLKGARKLALLLGPEGGWSSAERQNFDEHAFTRLALGPLILRVPTATVAALQHLHLSV